MHRDTNFVKRLTVPKTRRTCTKDAPLSSHPQIRCTRLFLGKKVVLCAGNYDTQCTYFCGAEEALDCVIAAMKSQREADGVNNATLVRDKAALQECIR